MSLEKYGEFEVIAKLAAKFPSTKHVLLGPGDDAAVVAMPDMDVVVSTDMAVEGVHFRRDWSSPIEIGAKIAAQNLADIVAMGAHPVAMTVAIATPSDTELSWLEALSVGIADECSKVGATVVGGDMSRAPQTVISITVLGQRRDWPVVKRSGARPGDIVALAGDVGWSAAGLACLRRGQRGPREAVERFRHPQPPYSAGPSAAKAGASAMIDVSDGLLADAGHIAEASGVGIDFSSESLAPPALLAEIGRNLGIDPWTWVLGGGEDHALLACFPAGTRLPARFRRVGVVRVAASPQVTVDGQPSLIQPGFDHFQGDHG